MRSRAPHFAPSHAHALFRLIDESRGPGIGKRASLLPLQEFQSMDLAKRRICSSRSIGTNAAGAFPSFDDELVVTQGDPVEQDTDSPTNVPRRYRLQHGCTSPNSCSTCNAWVVGWTCRRRWSISRERIEQR